MGEKELDASILEFRGFLNDHPLLRKKVRKSGESWQPYYEKWVLLGESDPFWDKYKEEDGNNGKESNVIAKLRKWTEETDMDQIQDRMKQWDQTISIIQGMLNQFRDDKKEKVVNRGYHDNKYRD
ncbi:hypothetical protein CFK37_16290 [Virgibacillus phasianinus]|uniref:Cytosolic protein n=1 Tax=Virgibacillus phasianinus TaxID=2017483 RepID=A0A220U6T5_9BACI|nr:spore coat protein YlbD [Virgibacillus phasianinus]ASK63606.1 hypothetical protein CFK37_16290 [Virgibacillus phasianinus]